MAGGEVRDHRQGLCRSASGLSVADSARGAGRGRICKRRRKDAGGKIIRFRRVPGRIRSERNACQAAMDLRREPAESMAGIRRRSAAIFFRSADGRADLKHGFLQAAQWMGSCDHDGYPWVTRDLEAMPHIRPALKIVQCTMVRGSHAISAGRNPANSVSLRIRESRRTRQTGG